MIRNVNRAWFEVWGTEMAQNRFLKGLLLFCLTVLTVQSIGLVILALRKPPVIAVSSTESKILTVTPPRSEFLEQEIRRAVTGYTQSHYNWEWNKVEDAFQKAANYVHPDFQKRFNQANEAQIKMTKEKKISQKFYSSEPRLNLKKKVASISGDRILIVEGLRATNSFTIEIEYDFGPRTEKNPEGVYIIGEKPIAASEGETR